jgi:uncharacterized protein (TIGR02453 family)
MAFRGWPVEAIEFYEGLEADNSKTYWTAHKDVFDRSVHGPMTALVEELSDEFGAGKIYRPYRDVRFSKDKSPYKTGIYATFEQGGYVRFSAQGLVAGLGKYLMTPVQIARYRRAVDEERSGTELAGIVAALDRQHITVAGSESLKTTPRGFPADHPRAELLRHKGLIAWREWPVARWLGTAAARNRVVDFLHTAQPLRNWLDTHVGATED